MSNKRKLVLKKPLRLLIREGFFDLDQTQISYDHCLFKPIQNLTVCPTLPNTFY